MINFRIKYLFIGILAIAGCSKVDKLTQFNLKYEQQVTIPSSTGINLPFNIITPPVRTNSDAAFSGNNTRKDLIEQIKLTRLNVTLISPTTEDFSFLKSIEIFITADGMPETKIASIEDIPPDTEKFLRLQTTGVNLKDYIQKDFFSLRFSTVTDEIITQDHEITCETTFFVDARLLGQ